MDRPLLSLFPATSSCICLCSCLRILAISGTPCKKVLNSHLTKYISAPEEKRVVSIVPENSGHQRRFDRILNDVEVILHSHSDMYMHCTTHF
jgi:hypothetical protein